MYYQKKAKEYMFWGNKKNTKGPQLSLFVSFKYMLPPSLITLIYLLSNFSLVYLM